MIARHFVVGRGDLLGILRKKCGWKYPVAIIERIGCDHAVVTTKDHVSSSGFEGHERVENAIVSDGPRSQHEHSDHWDDTGANGQPRRLSELQDPPGNH